VAIPRVETGRTDQRLVAIENAGRDEIDTEGGVSGLEKLSPQQQTYRELQAVLGGTITEAYAVANETAAGAAPSLTFKTKERARAATAAARIGLATTVLVVDAAGAYRGLQEYRVTNATEQFLEIQLPAGSRLWTATVAGQPVKPVLPEAAAGRTAAGATGTGAATFVVRIPLVKTAEGEGDYPVQLKYGGRMDKVASFAQVNFPLMRTVNINVELSQVRLHLPETHDWSSYFEFGGTMRHVEDESEAGDLFQVYLNNRIQEAKEFLASANPYTKIRAQSNLKQSVMLLDHSRSMAVGDTGRDLQTRNDALLREAEGQVQQQQAGQQAAAEDNRSRLNYYWNAQDVKRSKNVVSGLASNFDGRQTEEKGKESTFNSAWLDQNALGTRGEAAEGRDSKKEGEQLATGKPGGRYSRAGGKSFADDFSKPQGSAESTDGALAQGQAARTPQLANEQQRQQLQFELQKDADEVREVESRRSVEELSKLSRYGMNLDQSAQQQEFGGLAIQQPNQPAAPPLAPGGGPASGSGPDSGMGMGGYGAFRGAQLGGAGGGDPRYAAPGGLMGPLATQPAPGTTTSSSPPTTPPAITGDSYSNVAAGLASLDFRLPQRGRVYSFTTQRGSIEVTARPVALELIGRLAGLAGLATVVLLVWAATRRPAREAYARVFSTVASGVLLAVFGLVSLISGIFPVLGLVLVVAGIVLAIRNRGLPAAVPA
jgi:hypothetical protein